MPVLEAKKDRELKSIEELEMLFSRTAVHGIYALCYLNKAKSGATLSAPAVAEAMGIPRDQASKVLQSLSLAGLVESIRGRHGGYMLVRQFDQISVIDVLDALNPPEDDERLRPKTCERDSRRLCAAHSGLQRLNDRVRQSLIGETLAGLEGTVCSDSGAGGAEAALVSVTLGDHLS